MKKKTVMLIVASILLNILLAVDLASPQPVYNDDTGIGLNESEDIPVAVREALEEFLAERSLEKQQEKGQDYFEYIFISAWIAAVLLLLIGLMLRLKSSKPAIKRKLRRQILYRRINMLHKRGYSPKDIIPLLVKNNYSKKHASDAVYRYMHYLEKKEDLIPRLISAFKELTSFDSLRRKFRRKLLYSSISRKLDKGASFARIEKDLVREGWKRKHVVDTVYRYKRHLQDLRLMEQTPGGTLDNGRSRSRKLKRKLRRKLLFFFIIWLYKKGMGSEEVISDLVEKGWKRKHVEDAVYRYNLYIQGKTRSSWESGEGSVFDKLRRRFRRRVLYHLIKKQLKKGLNYSRIKKKLLEKGWEKKHVGDAIYRYQKYHDHEKTEGPAGFSAARKYNPFHILHKNIRKLKMFLLYRAYIKKRYNQGASSSQIKEELIEKGFNPHFVKAAIFEYLERWEIDNSR